MESTISSLKKSLLNILDNDSDKKELNELIQFVNEENRRNSFKSWIFSEDSQCSASRLAEAGFYYIGNKDEPDAVQCFLCDKPLDGWEEDDDPWKEHEKHSPQCKYIKLHKSQRKLTVQEFIDIHFEVTANWVQKYTKSKEMELCSEAKKLRKALQDIKKC